MPETTKYITLENLKTFKDLMQSSYDLGNTYFVFDVELEAILAKIIQIAAYAGLFEDSFGMEAGTEIPLYVESDNPLSSAYGILDYLCSTASSSLLEGGNPLGNGEIITVLLSYLYSLIAVFNLGGFQVFGLSATFSPALQKSPLTVPELLLQSTTTTGTDMLDDIGLNGIYDVVAAALCMESADGTLTTANKTISGTTVSANLACFDFSVFGPSLTYELLRLKNPTKYTATNFMQYLESENRANKPILCSIYIKYPIIAGYAFSLIMHINDIESLAAFWPDIATTNKFVLTQQIYYPHGDCLGKAIEYEMIPLRPSLGVLFGNPQQLAARFKTLVRFDKIAQIYTIEPV